MNKIIIFTSIALAFMLTACSEEESYEGKEYDSQVSFSEKPIVLSYDTYIEDTDVQILNSDTTEISVSRDYLYAIGADFDALKADTIPVAIWRTINTAPFVRKVVAYKEQGDRMILTSVPGDIADVLPNCDVYLNTDIYVDFSQAEQVTRAYTSGVNQNRYIDAEGVIHPAVIILDRAGIENEDAATRGATENIYYTAEDLAKSNASFNIINVDRGLGNHELMLADGSDYVKIYVKDTHIKAKAGMRVALQTKSFKLKKFECGVYGDLGLDFTAGVEAGKKISKEKESTIASFNCFTSVFWVGYVPVAITCDAGLKLKGEASLSAKCKLESDLSFSASYNAGVKYSGKWSDYNEAKCDANAKLSVVQPFEVNASVKTGAYLFVDVSLYGFTGPYLTVGPSVLADCALSYNAINNNFSVKTNGQIKVGGELGAQLKVWKWQLASWGVDYTIWKYNLWDETYVING